ncbi:T9SS type A sorting domain-containing protein, partial [Flavobacteriales bacterium]|nr:T9SS type A sorting domain-containing protein [Flavobacteriales bacterium]
NVTFTSDKAQTLSIKVLNILGEVVYTQEFTNFKGQFMQSIDLTQYSKGIYSLEIGTFSENIYTRIALQ